MRSNFRCIRCGELKTAPDDRYGSPRFDEVKDESRGLCLECGEKEPIDHIAENAMTELSLHADHIAATYDFLDRLSEQKYVALEWGKAKPKKLDINEEVKQNGLS